jgi:hypothetical protein
VRPDDANADTYGEFTSSHSYTYAKFTSSHAHADTSFKSNANAYGEFASRVTDANAQGDTKASADSTSSAVREAVISDR